MIYTKVLRIFYIWILFFVSIEMFKNDPNCGRMQLSSNVKSTQFIVGGKDAQIKQFPFMVSLRRLSQRNYPEHIGRYGKHTCGATILNKRWILTADHCLRGLNYGRAGIVVGMTDLTEDVPDINWYSPELLVYYGCTEGEGGDIGLIRTDREMIQLDENNTDIGAVCLPVANSFPSNKTLFHTGWGVFQKYGNRLSNVLQMAETELFSKNYCKYFESFGNLGFNLDFDEPYPKGKKLCVKAPDNQGCKGDSGGPLFEVIDGRAVQVGITSHLIGNLIFMWLGYYCSGSEALKYTQVSPYIDWIDAVLESVETDLIANKRCDPKMPFQVFRINMTSIKD